MGRKNYIDTLLLDAAQAVSENRYIVAYQKIVEAREYGATRNDIVWRLGRAGVRKMREWKMNRRLSAVHSRETN